MLRGGTVSQREVPSEVMDSLHCHVCEQRQEEERDIPPSNRQSLLVWGRRASSAGGVRLLISGL